MTREEIDKIKNIPIVFIVGKGRSGTTLLQSLLNSHPSVIAPPESKFIVIHASRFGKKAKWTRSDIFSFVNVLYTELFFVEFWKLDKQKLTDSLLAAIDYLDYSLACKIVYYAMHGEKKSIVLLSDKNPFYSIFIPTLLRIFPDARFIHLVRNPSDNISSTLRAFKLKNTIYMSLQWIMFNKIIESNKQSLPERYFTLRYEDMVSNVKAVMESVCEFLQIQFSGEMTDINRTEIKDTYLNEKMAMGENKKSMLEPISTKNIGKWKKELNAEDISIVESITANYAFKKYGYQPDEQNIKSKPPYFKIAIWKIIYCIWLPFTRLRYKIHSVNVMYSKLKKAMNKNVKPEWGEVIN